MKKVIIPQNLNANATSLSHSGTDRVIKLRKGCKYAFVNVSFYGGYTTFKSIEAAAKFAHKSQIAGRVIDDEGNVYYLNHYYNENDFALKIEEQDAYEVVS